MICPQCAAEFREGFDRCSDCDVALVAAQPAEIEDHEGVSFVKIFETSEIDVIPVIKSLLHSAGIPFHTGGEAMMNLFPSGLLGPIMAHPGKEISFSVPEASAEEARQLLAAEPLATPELADEDNAIE